MWRCDFPMPCQPCQPGLSLSLCWFFLRHLTNDLLMHKEWMNTRSGRWKKVDSTIVLISEIRNFITHNHRSSVSPSFSKQRLGMERIKKNRSANRFLKSSFRVRNCPQKLEQTSFFPSASIHRPEVNLKKLNQPWPKSADNNNHLLHSILVATI